MLHLIQSNKMEVLADSLISCLKETAQQGHSVFEPDQILVQSPGMSQWLKIQIAEAMGITANIDFPLPSSYIWQMYKQHISDLPEESAFTKSNMTWKIISILPKLLSKAEFSSIQEYLDDQQPIKLYQLASKIADVYDQYLVYRPEWILGWEKGEDNVAELAEIFTDTNSQQTNTQQTDAQQTNTWQPILWRELVKYSHSLGESIYHRANLHESLLTELTGKESNKQQKPLLVFGISAMPLQQLEVLSALAKSREVVIFWFNPSHHYWGDIIDNKTHAKTQLKAIENPQLGAELFDVGNPLLASWGKLGRDYQDMLLNFELQLQDCFIETDPTNILSHIQTDINQLQFRGTPNQLSANELLTNGFDFPKVEILSSDHSIQVHACHSKVRELEILHDQLLKMFNQNPSWSPADVIVMMPDVATYAPYIEGVFGGVDNNLFIPYAISDRNFSQVSPLINSFISLMKLHQSRSGLSEVLSLMEVPSIQNKFEISLQDFELIQHWLNDVGIRWGWDAEDKKRWDLPAEQQNTWLFGLQRLLAGYAMSETFMFAGHENMIAPYADIEGQQAVALGKCYQFIQVLIKVLDFCQHKHTIASKVELALALLDELYEVEENEQIELITVRGSLEAILSHQDQFIGDLEQDIFVSELEQNIQEKGVGQRFLAGYVNFCTLMPMRSIPFKLVCLLGLNDGDYPRQTVPMGFDLMRLTPVKRGDRSRRLDDRYLFLEALLSAREALYLSYQGFSQKDNSVLSPSILLSELLEYCQQGFALKGQLTLKPEETELNLVNHLSIAHKLHGFDSAYFDEGNQGFDSFNQNLQQLAERTREEAKPKSFFTPECESEFESQSKSESKLADKVKEKASEDSYDLDVNQLIEFYLNPARAFFINRWQSRFYPFAKDTSDVEPFAFDGLDRFQINQTLVNTLVKEIHDGFEFKSNAKPNPNSRIDQVVTEFRAQGLLPVGESGDLALQTLLKMSHKIATQISHLAGEHNKAHFDLELHLNGFNLNGRITELYGQSLILWRPGKLREIDKVCLYLQWLCVCAKPPKSGLESAWFVTTEKPYQLAKIESSQAQLLLSDWLQIYEKGQQEVIHFYPTSAWNWLKNQDQNKCIQTFKGNQFKAGEAQETHIQRVCPDLALVFDEFCQLSESLLMPLFELEKQK
ncbi:exodeoxyribonuclease V subunit gamma [Paraglaciecola sp.]|uniref:exodeoxyribonuclease V subunit gamma n=1 Tax=Paraglaciecola sp. TaxID=1920173 RepID=UPI003EF1AD44